MQNLAFLKNIVIRALSWTGKDLVPRLILTWKESNAPILVFLEDLCILFYQAVE